MIEGILFLNGVLMRLLGLFLDMVGVLTTVGVFTIDLVLVPGVAAGLFTGVEMVGLSKTFLDFHCFSGSRSGSRPFCAPWTGGRLIPGCTSTASSDYIKVRY